MKFLKFYLLLWVIFALPDPDPDSEYGSGSTDLIESGSNAKPWKMVMKCIRKKKLLVIVHTVGFYLAGERAGQLREPGICHTGGGQGAG